MRKIRVRAHNLFSSSSLFRCLSYVLQGLIFSNLFFLETHSFIAVAQVHNNFLFSATLDCLNHAIVSVLACFGVFVSQLSGNTVRNLIHDFCIKVCDLGMLHDLWRRVPLSKFPHFDYYRFWIISVFDFSGF